MTAAPEKMQTNIWACSMRSFLTKARWNSSAIMSTRARQISRPVVHACMDGWMALVGGGVHAGGGKRNEAR